ncbi:MAG: hypothetical protein JRF33_04205 [Deltaproteobacteria bacterium]|nr:hypothetical protein [Deltaproteobacteria bacterium]
MDELDDREEEDREGLNDLLEDPDDLEEEDREGLNDLLEDPDDLEEEDREGLNDLLEDPDDLEKEDREGLNDLLGDPDDLGAWKLGREPGRLFGAEKEGLPGRTPMREVGTGRWVEGEENDGLRPGRLGAMVAP